MNDPTDMRGQSTLKSIKSSMMLAKKALELKLSYT